MARNQKCFNCHQPIPPAVLPFFWETYRGYERAHCSAHCQSQTHARKTRPAHAQATGKAAAK